MRDDWTYRNDMKRVAIALLESGHGALLDEMAMTYRPWSMAKIAARRAVFPDPPLPPIEHAEFGVAS